MFARTSRLTLRPGWPEDAPALAAAIGHEAVAARFGDSPWPYGLDDAQAYLSAATAATEPRFLIWRHEGAAPQLIGGIGLSLEGGEHGLGFWLTPDAWGRGFATEAARAVVDIARHALPIDRLTASHPLDDPASGRVLRKIGFRENGRVARCAQARGAIVGSVRWTLDFKAQAPVPLAA